MNNRAIFISHSSKDDVIVKELRVALESSGLTVWADSRNLRGGDNLAQEIEEAIEQARQFIAVISVETINSPWVRKEIAKALEVERRRSNEGYRVIPLLLPGVEPPALQLWFDEEPVGIRVETGPGGLSEALPQILAAVGEQLPTDRQPVRSVPSPPIEELILKLYRLGIETKGSKRLVRAVAQLIHKPADNATREVESRPFIFTAPIGVIEVEDLRWYLEDYFVWPVGVFKERAERIESLLPEWGQQLYQITLASAAKEAVTAWQQHSRDSERRFSVFVDGELPDSSSEEEIAAAREAAAELLSLPWELLHDGRGFLFHGKYPIRVRRRLPNRHPQRVRQTQLPVRILLVSPRPEDARTGYIDHRISAKPLVEAVERLGELVKLSALTPPTFPALEEALQKAADAGEPFDVVHFDGHGIYDPTLGLGVLCFEDPHDTQKLENRAVKLVHAERLAEVIRDHRIPLVFLEACQTAKAEVNPTASVAAKLLEEGVISVVAMSHSILVETAHRFVKAFYHELVLGRRIGTAMLAGQRELHGDDYRGKRLGAGELHLQDWFVPVLYQEELDPQIIAKSQPEDVLGLQSRQRRLSLGELPDTPAHGFEGRSRELLALERLLHQEPYAVIRGQGGVGKTTLASELARWLVRLGRFSRAAFVSLEQHADARSMLDSIGRQLLPEGRSWSVARYSDLKQALQPVERLLADRPTIIVLDNLESLLTAPVGQSSPDQAAAAELFDLCRKLLEVSHKTRIVFTSRASLPAPFDGRRNEIRLGPLSTEDAIRLVSEVMKLEGLVPKSDDAGNDPHEVMDLVEAVDRHPRALVLLSREVSRRGVRATTTNLRQLMAELHRRNPGDRENSLYASVELSLRRLPPQMRQQIRVLGVFHGGVSLYLLSLMLGLGKEAVLEIARKLIEVGLATYVGETHLRLDPALPSYLLLEMSQEEKSIAQAKWADLMEEYAAFLYRQRFQHTDVSNKVTLLELPNLLALLDWTIENSTTDEVAHLASGLEQLIAPLGRPRVLEKLRQIRERVVQSLTPGDEALFNADCQAIDRLISRGELHLAYDAARKLMARLLDAGENAYQGIDYDVAIAQVYMGRIMRMIGNTGAALENLIEAQHRFQLMSGENRMAAQKMQDVITGEIMICLSETGQVSKAISLFEEEIKKAERSGDKRGVAVLKNNLGSVYWQQNEYAKALEVISEGKRIFEALGEPGGIAAALHQLGVTYRYAGNYEQAELAFKQALAIMVREQLSGLEAGTLDELGILYSQMGRLEDGVAFFRRAVGLRAQLQDLRSEGISRGNLGISLFRLRRYDEARNELHRAIECRTPFGHSAEPWKVWIILHGVEQAAGNLQAAAEARAQAIKSYLAYRQDGGQNVTRGAKLCAQVADAFSTGNTAEVEQTLAQTLRTNVPEPFKLLVLKLQNIMQGNLNSEHADDPSLEYTDAVELKLLLEAIS